MCNVRLSEITIDLWISKNDFCIVGVYFDFEFIIWKLSLFIVDKNFDINLIFRYIFIKYNVNQKYYLTNYMLDFIMEIKYIIKQTIIITIK